VALAAERGGVVVGFLLGTVDDRRHYRYVMRRHGAGLGLCGTGSLLMRPRLASTFLRTRGGRYARGGVRLVGRPPGDEPSAISGGGVLTHVAVCESDRGSRIGTDLVHAFVAASAALGAAQLRLATKRGSDGAGAFYERLGWLAGRSFEDTDGREWQSFHLNAS